MSSHSQTKATRRGCGRPLLDPVQNWWSKVDATARPDACWVWKAATDRDGYGKFAIGLGGKRQIHTRAHRFAYEQFVAPIPVGMVVCHRCDNPPCCNPAHLFVGTSKENNDDKVAKGRHAKLWGTPLKRSRQTHCRRGHSYDQVNTYLSSRGHRSCRTCRRAAAMRSYWKRRGQ